MCCLTRAHCTEDFLLIDRPHLPPDGILVSPMGARHSVGRQVELGRSQDLLARAQRVIPGATQTFSKGPTQWVQGIAPIFAGRVKGPYLWDVDGNRYFDLPMALGPVILGHGHPAVTAAIERALADGITFTLPHPLETEVAETIVGAVPGAEMVRFAKSGSDATSAAVRAARALTGRERIAFSGYHGWHDWHIGATSRSAGVPRAVRELSHEFTFNDLDLLDAVLNAHEGEFAAIILEPAGLHEPTPGFLEGIRSRADSLGALLVFDEIITGFRLGMGGAQEHYGIQADLVCFGKALANGMPLSAVAGPERYMRVFEDEVFFSGTHGGEVLSLAACRATLEVLDTEDVHPNLWRRGERLMSAINAAAQRHDLAGRIAASGAAPRSVVSVTEPDPEAGAFARTLLQQELVKRGVLFNGSNFICHAHTDEDIEEIAAAYVGAIARVAELWPDGIAEALEGAPLAPVFRQP
jgi:glutamate-1-semialdehyde aminotransferase